VALSLDRPERSSEIQDVIRDKAGLRELYVEFYARFKKSLEGCPHGGKIVEIGSGAGFLKAQLPEAITSDILPYQCVDIVVDATRMPFEENGLSAILLLNVFHHIADVERLFEEALRCLMPKGKLIIIDQYPGWIGKPILKYVHHEPFDDARAFWDFPTTGPLSGANGALAWMVFFRDRASFERKYPGFRIVRREPHTPLRYWLAGGLKRWSLLPRSLFPLATAVDSWLVRLSPEFGSFLHVDVQKG
jgi:SAM-dependent methyltransferase